MNLAVKSKSKEAFLVILLASALYISVPLQSALGSSKSPYESGYDHGCDDASISDSSDRYINQPEKGPSFHTNEFMNGYDAGFNSCGSTSSYYEPEQSNNDQYSASNENSGNKQDMVTSFCSALQRGDLRAAQVFVSLLDGGSLAMAAEAFCAGWNLGPILESQGVFN